MVCSLLLLAAAEARAQQLVPSARKQTVRLGRVEVSLPGGRQETVAAGVTYRNGQARRWLNPRTFFGRVRRIAVDRLPQGVSLDGDAFRQLEARALTILQAAVTQLPGRSRLAGLKRLLFGWFRRSLPEEQLATAVLANDRASDTLRWLHDRLQAAGAGNELFLEQWGADLYLVAQATGGGFRFYLASGDGVPHESGGPRLTVPAVLDAIEYRYRSLWRSAAHAISGGGRSGADPTEGFARSGATVVLPGDTSSRVTFDDVAGADQAVLELREVVDFFKNPEKYRQVGARQPRGVLLVGPPGTGKTLLARAVAGEAGVPFFSISGSQFVEMFVGVGAARVRDLFEAAKAGRAVIFIDELDAIGRERTHGAGGSDERNQALNQLLTEMDGFDESKQVIIAATNHPDALDPALRRPGRFDREVTVSLPGQSGRQAILQVHARGKQLDPTVSLDELAGLTNGFSGAQLANLLNEAAILAVRRGRSAIGRDEALDALDRITGGTGTSPAPLSTAQRQRVAAYRTGQALMAGATGQPLPPRLTLASKVTSPGDTGKGRRTAQELRERIRLLLAGWQAEKLLSQEPSEQSLDDLQEARRLAQQMVVGGMGPRELAGVTAASTTQLSETTRQQHEADIQRILTEELEEVRTFFTSNTQLLRDAVHRLADTDKLDTADLLKGLTPP